MKRLPPRVFVCGSINENGDRGTFCRDHVPSDVLETIGESFVDTWDGDDGKWKKDIRCQVCDRLLARASGGLREA